MMLESEPHPSDDDELGKPMEIEEFEGVSLKEVENIFSGEDADGLKKLLESIESAYLDKYKNETDKGYKESLVAAMNEMVRTNFNETIDSVLDNPENEEAYMSALRIFELAKGADEEKYPELVNSFEVAFTSLLLIHAEDNRPDWVDLHQHYEATDALPKTIFDKLTNYDVPEKVYLLAKKAMRDEDKRRGNNELGQLIVEWRAEKRAEGNK